MTAASEEIDMSPSGSPGAALRQLREARNLSVAEVAQRLKYGQRQIEALERDDFGKLQGMTFVRGMIRGYARALGADPEVILQELERQPVPDTMTVDLRGSSIPFPDGRKKTTRVYAALSVLLIATAVLIGYEMLPLPSDPSRGNEAIASQQSEKPAGAAPVATTVARLPEDSAPQTATIAPTTAAALPQSAVVAASVASSPPGSIPGPMALSATSATPPVGGTVQGKRIVLLFDKESWVEIKQANGKTLLSQLNPGGSRQVVEGIPPFVLIIGNAASVHLSYNDQPVDLRPYFKVDVARLTLE